MKKAGIFALFSALLAGISCSDETTVFQDDLEDDLVLENSNAVLEGAISFEDAGVLDIYDENSQSGKSADVAGDYPLTVVASVEPPSYQSGDNLTASHVDLEGNYAYVAYNTAGEGYYGAIDVVNVADPHNPRVTSRLFYLNADINSLQFENGYIYAVGGVNSETSVRATSNSFLARIPVSGGRMNTNGVDYGFQQGYNATDVLILSDRILVSSGKEGSVTAYSKADLSILQEVYVADARSLAQSETGIAVLDAGAGVRLWDSNLNETSLVSVGSDLGEATKKTLSVRNNRIMVAEAAQGAGVYDATTGELLEYIPIPIHPDGVDAGDVVTNAVVGNEEAIFMANGGAGLCLSEEDQDGSELVGIIELDGSVNYVESKGDYAFAATGEGGLQIIRLNRPSESLESQCQGLSAYNGSRTLNVSAGQTLAYRGRKRLNTVIVGGELLMCGSWTVSNHMNIQDGGTLELYGILAVGRYNRRRNITVGEGATLRIEGDVTIYGDLILQDGAAVEFLGNASEIDIFGTVKINGDATITGTFRDVRNRF